MVGLFSTLRSASLRRARGALLLLPLPLPLPLPLLQLLLPPLLRWRLRALVSRPRMGVGESLQEAVYLQPRAAERDDEEQCHRGVVRGRLRRLLRDLHLELSASSSCLDTREKRASIADIVVVSSGHSACKLKRGRQIISATSHVHTTLCVIPWF